MVDIFKITIIYFQNLDYYKISNKQYFYKIRKVKLPIYNNIYNRLFKLNYQIYFLIFQNFTITKKNSHLKANLITILNLRPNNRYILYNWI